MKTNIYLTCLLAVLANASVGRAQSSRHVLMEGGGEFGWSINRPSKIQDEAEGRALALAALTAQIEGMANIEAFEQFSKTEVKKTLSNKVEKIGDLLRNTTTYTSEDRKENAFKANKRGLVITVREAGFKPGTFSHSSDYNKLTGVRKSKASGILLYTFKVYAPEGYNPNGGGKAGGSDRVVKIEYTIKNDSGRTVSFRLPTGKEYTLRNGEQGSYKNTGEPGSFKILILSSGREYTLTSGNHKLWWMSKENRVGFDLNYDKK